MNRLPLHLIVPLTSGSQPSRFRPEATFGDRTGRFLPDQMRAVDRSRMLRKLGSLPPSDLLRLLAVLQEMFED